MIIVECSIGKPVMAHLLQRSIVIIIDNNIIMKNIFIFLIILFLCEYNLAAQNVAQTTAKDIALSYGGIWTYKNTQTRETFSIKFVLDTIEIRSVSPVQIDTIYCYYGKPYYSIGGKIIWGEDNNNKIKTWPVFVNIFICHPNESYMYFTDKLHGNKRGGLFGSLIRLIAPDKMQWKLREEESDMLFNDEIDKEALKYKTFSIPTDVILTKVK
jgi:hypothetical protein